MREIKFRAWDESQNYMAYQGTPDLETLQSFIHHFGNKKMLQFTGLKDKNGKEIYFGDIVKWDDGSEGEYWRVAIVEWERGGISMRVVKNTLHDLSLREGYKFHFQTFAGNDSDLIICGNIYENHELLQ